VLASRPEDPCLDSGVTVCACFGVGRNAIEAAIDDGCHDLSSIGYRLRAGINCGSCVPELRRLLANAESHQLTENSAHRQLIAG
jgi:assimilatory nitrate reductase catalytic subunit